MSRPASPHGTYNRYQNGKCRCDSCREAKAIRSREHQQPDPTARKAYMKAYWADPVNAERNRIKNLEVRRQRRRDVVEKLGGKCVRCGYTGTALQVDHIHDDGYVERRQDGQNFQRKMYLRVLAGEPGYQLLCANCNWEKRFAREA